jgi:hypothetical protein
MNKVNFSSVYLPQISKLFETLRYSLWFIATRYNALSLNNHHHKYFASTVIFGQLD